PLTKVFSEIEKQTNYSFIFADKLLANTKPVTLEVTNEKIETVLSLCLKDQPLTYSISNPYIVIKPKTLPDQKVNPRIDTIPRRTITGKVQLDDSTKSDLPNVTVLNRNT